MLSLSLVEPKKAHWLWALWGLDYLSRVNLGQPLQIKAHQVIRSKEVLLLDIEEVEAKLEHFDLVHLESRRLLDLVEVNSGKVLGRRHRRSSVEKKSLFLYNSISVIVFKTKINYN